MESLSKGGLSFINLSMPNSLEKSQDTLSCKETAFTEV